MAIFQSIEGNPFITRFKTSDKLILYKSLQLSIEGNPFITRFKTIDNKVLRLRYLCIEGNPFITRFKTTKYESI